MSGIYGIFHKNGDIVTPRTLAPLTAALLDWGPDGQSSWRDGPVGLGHSMLHTTPESLYEQLPVAHCHYPHLVITADARIDNREHLAAMLDIAPGEQQTITDNMLILFAYERWGQDCAKKLIGDFAFAIWDQRRQWLFCGRDIMGCKPFYYYNDDRVFVFASDIEGILACSWVPQCLNEALFALYLQEDSAFAEKQRTFFADIVKLPPAHQLVITKKHHRLTRYWSVDCVQDVRLPSDEVYAEQLRELLFEAVRCRVRTPFPVGAHLSGGLDSSTVTAIAAQLLREQGQTLTAYSWSPALPATGELPDDERQLIRTLCDSESIQCHYIDLKVEDVVRTYRRDFTRRPYEMMLREALTQRQAAQNKVRIILSGWGGDEAITGHGWGYWSSLFLRGHWWKLHQEILSLVKLSEVTGLGKRLKRYVGMTYGKVLCPLIPEPIWMRWQGSRPGNYSVTCIQEHFAARHSRAVTALRGPSLRERPSVRMMQWRWLDNGHLTRRIEAWAINGARQRLVYHYPLLDQRILEFALGAPPEQFVQQGRKRSLMRRAVAGVLSETIRRHNSKVEPAAFGVIGAVLVEALPELFRLLATKPGTRHPAAHYVDLEKMQEVINQTTQTTDLKQEVEPLLITLACARISALFPS